MKKEKEIGIHTKIPVALKKRIESNMKKKQWNQKTWIINVFEFYLQREMNVEILKNVDK